MASGKVLNLYTASYPYGWGESYLDAEIKSLLSEFDKIVLFPMKYEDRSHRNLSEKVIIEKLAIGGQGFSLKEEFEIFSIMLREMAGSENVFLFISKWRSMRAELKKAIRYANTLEKDPEIQFQKHYSFWMNDWSLALAVLKKRKKIDSFVFRVNGFDIYDERHPFGFIPFRLFIYSNVSRIFAVSDNARSYLVEKFGYSDKIKTAHFGTEDFGRVIKQPFSDEFRILSCSRLIPLKNITQLARVVGRLKFKTAWMHHGEGVEFENILNIVSQYPENIRFLNQGFIEDHDKAVYSQKDFLPDLFISLSTTEGLPVTLIQAISFGIPVIATDVGGCREVVNEITGILLPYPVTDDEVLKAINEIRGEHWQSESKRNEIRKFWEENFYAAKCYGEFSRKISS